MTEPTPVTEDGDVIGLPPLPPPADDSVNIEPEPEVVLDPPPPPPGLMVDDAG
jgi:hypothetical protein